MRRIVFFTALVAAFFTLTACGENPYDPTAPQADLYNDPTAEEGSKEPNDEDHGATPDDGSQRIIKISYFMNEYGTTKSMQGCALYNNVLFHFVNGNSEIYAYDVEKKTFLGVIKGKSNSKWHNNQAAFSHTFYEDGDEFPLLYTSQIDPEEQSIQAWRVQRTDTLFSLTKVQDIKMPYDTDENNLFHFNMVIDDDGKHFWLYSRNRDTAMGQISKWELPAPHEKSVVLTEEDMLERFPISVFMQDAQGGTMIAQRIYFVQGVPSRSELMFHIVNVNTQEVKSFNLRDYKFAVEPEGLSFHRGRFICPSNRRGIYEIYLNTY